MSKEQSEREYLDETYNRLSNCARGAGARARLDSEMQDSQKEADDAWRAYSEAAKRAEDAFSKFEGVLKRKGLLP